MSRPDLSELRALTRMPRRKRSIKRSGYEDKIAKDLDERGIRYEYEPYKLEYFSKVPGLVVWDTYAGKEVPIPGHFQISKRRWYTPDFVIPTQDPDVNGVMSDLCVEAKGRLTGPTRTKMLDVKAAHPDLAIHFLFYRKEKINLKRTPYNTDWAEANGFPYAVGHEVPEEWL